MHGLRKKRKVEEHETTEHMMEKPKHEQSKEEHDDTIGANQEV